MSPHVAGFVCGAGLVAGFASCSRIGSPDIASLNLTCAPAPRTVQCRLLALSTDVGRPPCDVTAAASWHLSGLTGARMAPDGRLTAPDNTEGDVRVEAEFESHRAHVHARVRRTGPGQLLGVLRGRVYLEVGNRLRPVPLAHVEVVGGANHGLTTSTDQNGAYELVALMPGDIVIRATKPECTAAEGAIEVLAGENRLSLLIAQLPSAAATSALPLIRNWQHAVLSWRSVVLLSGAAAFHVFRWSGLRFLSSLHRRRILGLLADAIFLPHTQPPQSEPVQGEGPLSAQAQLT